MCVGGVSPQPPPEAVPARPWDLIKNPRGRKVSRGRVRAAPSPAASGDGEDAAVPCVAGRCYLCVLRAAFVLREERKAAALMQSS